MISIMTKTFDCHGKRLLDDAGIVVTQSNGTTFPVSGGVTTSNDVVADLDHQ